MRGYKLALLVVISLAFSILLVDVNGVGMSYVFAEVSPAGVANITFTLDYVISLCTCTPPGHLSLTAGKIKAWIPDTTVYYNISVCVRDVKPGWVFDHWERDGTTVSRSPCYMETFMKPKTVRYIAVFKRAGEVESNQTPARSAGVERYKVRINWVGKGKTSPLAGDYYLRNGSTLCLNVTYVWEGWEFEKWGVNGKEVYERSFCLTVNRSYQVIAFFRQVERFRAKGVDAEMNRDLLDNLSAEKLVILGGPLVEPFDWEEIGVKFVKEGGIYRKLLIGNETYGAVYGYSDYSVIYITDTAVRIAGITRYGTRAGLIWFLRNEKAENGLYVVEWVDLNGNASVDSEEISLVARA